MALDTDSEALDRSSASKKFLLGRSITGGIGCGGDPQKAASAVTSDEAGLREFLGSYDLIFLMCGLGGGTGTGAADCLASLMADMGIQVYVFAAMPFFFEGKFKCSMAEQALQQLRSQVKGVFSFPNQKLFSWAAEDKPAAEAVQRFNGMTVRAVFTLARVLRLPGLLNLAPGDLQQLFEGAAGDCLVGYGEASDDHALQEALDELKANPVLADEALIRRSAVLLVAVLGGRSLTLSEIQQVADHVQSMARHDADIKMAAVVDETQSGGVSITVLSAASRKEEPDSAASDRLPPPASDGGAGDDKKKIKGRKSTGQQAVLALDGPNKGRFTDVAPTIFDGNDLDIPTFRRKGIRIPS